MNITNYDIKDIGTTLKKIDEGIALKKIANGEEIFLRTSAREIYTKVSLGEIERVKRLKDLGVYDKLEFYVK